jgi:hypothetical protein
MEKPKMRIDKDGNKFWELNGKYHRTDGPAVDRYDKNNYWFQNGKLHRIDGPAIELSFAYKEWRLNDIQYTIIEYYQKLWEIIETQQRDIK